MGLPAEQLPTLRHTLRTGGLFLIPLVVLVYFLEAGYSPTYVALMATLTVVVVAFFRRATRPSPRQLYETLVETTVRMVTVTAATAAAGLVIGGITMTGLGGKFARLIFSMTGDSQLFTLIMVAALVILLGMGMPTPSAYILAAVLAGPILNELGVSLLAGHLFLVYFASMSAITPPVAVAAYAAASIAGEHPIKIATMAVRLGVVVFVVPFIFMYNQSLLLQGSWTGVAQAVITAILGTTALACAVEGWFRSHLSWWERILLLVGGVMMMVPEIRTDLSGLVLAAAGLARQGLVLLRSRGGRAGPGSQVVGKL